MNKFISTFQSQEGSLWKAGFEHIQISLLALFIAILIAIPLALLLQQFSRTAEVALQVTGIFQTIPSLALLGLMIPIVGIGTLPAVVALVVYALFPILQTTYTGLHQIDPSLAEAASAFGMNRMERLIRYELAIAMPFIMAGVRTAAVMIIGTATLAALIGAGGLGNFILLGINSNNINLILIGAISSAILAVIFSFFLRRLERAKIRTILISFFAMLLLLFSSFLTTVGTHNQTITIGGKLGSEPNIIIHMYKELIEAKSDIQVVLKPNFGDTTFLYKALKSGKIDIYPEYTGTLTTTFLNQPTSSTDPTEVWQIARKGIEKKDHLTYLSPMNFQDTFALAVKPEEAKQKGLKAISDLADFPGLVAGFDLEFANRLDGYKGLQVKYGLRLEVKTMQTSLIYNALNAGNIQVAEVYSTDSQIKQYDLSILKDDKTLFPPYQAAPLMKNTLDKKYPELRTILEKLSNKVTTQEMQEMNYQVNVKQEDPGTVAHDFLVREKILK